MRAGKLRHRITIQSNVPSRGGMGGVEDSWTDLYSAWADIRPKSGREFWASDGIFADVTHGIEIRYRENITPEHRIKFGTRIFSISSVLNFDERNEKLIILAKEQL